MKKILCIFLSLYLAAAHITTLCAIEPEPRRPHPPSITASAAIVMDARSGIILYEKNIDQSHYPASITKIMTALLALEQYGNHLYTPVAFSHQAVFSIPRNSSHIAMDEGETLSLLDALYGLMLPSANEVANAIAEHISGDIESFAELMNRRAFALGARNTRFENPSGLHDLQQHTTAYDMAVITREALRHPVFLEVISARRHIIPPTERQEESRHLLNTHRMIQPGPYFNEWVIGGKTGFTSQARHTVVTYAEQEGQALLVVTLNGETAGVFSDTQALLDYAFAIPYVSQQIFNRGDFSYTVPVFETVNSRRRQIGEVVLAAAQDLYVPLPLGFDRANIQMRTVSNMQMSAPVTEGDAAGRLVFSVRGTPIGEVALRAAHSVPRYGTAAEPAEVYVPVEEAVLYEPAPPQPFLFFLPFASVEEMAENYYFTFMLPLGIFATLLVILTWIFKILRSRKQARMGRHTVIGTQLYKYRKG